MKKLFAVLVVLFSGLFFGFAESVEAPASYLPQPKIEKPADPNLINGSSPVVVPNDLVDVEEAHQDLYGIGKATFRLFLASPDHEWLGQTEGMLTYGVANVVSRTIVVNNELPSAYHLTSTIAHEYAHIYQSQFIGLDTFDNLFVFDEGKPYLERKEEIYAYYVQSQFIDMIFRALEKGEIQSEEDCFNSLKDFIKNYDFDRAFEEISYQKDAYYLSDRNHSMADTFMADFPLTK